MAKSVNISIITVGAAIFLGVLEEKEKATIIKDALALPAGTADVEKSHFADYLKAENLGTLKEVKLSGAGVTFAQEELSADQKLEFQILQLQMAKALETAPKKQVNAEFDALVGR